MTNYPIKVVLKKPELSEGMAKWVIALKSYDIRYHPRTASNSQALSNFVAYFTPGLEQKAQQEAQTIL